jgi:hypothetical protein
VPRWHVLLASSLAAALAACGGSADSPTKSTATRDVPAPRDWLVERAHASGLDFTHFNGMSGAFYYPEIMAPGVALLDYDNDGDLDVYVTQGQMLGAGKTLADAFNPPTGELRDRLFRNDLVVNADGTRTVHFTDVTAQSGIDLRTYGMGVAVGDFDNDGHVDIYRTGLTGGTMLHNNGDGTFTDVTQRTRTETAGQWSVSAAFVDYDRDGWLDLWVGNYLIYSTAADVQCLSVSGRRDYCPPNSYRAQASHLFHNRHGVFEDVTRTALVGGAYGPALGVSTADFNNDGWIDLYVANDGQPNQLWINQHDGTFKDTAFLAGVALSGAGQAEASMGVDAGDFDNDGDEDLFITNWLDQMNVLYVNDGTGTFEDRRAATGVGAPSLARTGFGTAWFDVDSDGWLDLFVANGGVATIESQARAGDKFPLRMAPSLYRNLGNGHFDHASGKAGAVFNNLYVGRGAAFGDIDNDGDTDIVVAQAAGPLQLLINTTFDISHAPAAHWLGLRLMSGSPQRDALGARVEVRQKDRVLWRRARSDGSYASANDPRVLVGLGAVGDKPTVRVTWPDGKREEWTDVATDRYTTLVEGSGH